MVEITVRDVVYLVTFVGSISALYVGLVVRLTRLEALVNRVEKVEETVGELQGEVARQGRELAAVSSGRRGR